MCMLHPAGPAVPPLSKLVAAAADTDETQPMEIDPPLDGGEGAFNMAMPVLDLDDDDGELSESHRADGAGADDGDDESEEPQVWFCEHVIIVLDIQNVELIFHWNSIFLSGSSVLYILKPGWCAITILYALVESKT